MLFVRPCRSFSTDMVPPHVSTRADIGKYIISHGNNVDLGASKHRIKDRQGHHLPLMVVIINDSHFTYHGGLMGNHPTLVSFALP